MSYPRSRGALRRSHLRPLPPLLRRTPRPRLHPHLRPRPRRRRRLRPLRAPAPDAGQQATSPPAPSPEKPAAPPVVAQQPSPQPTPAPLTEAPLPPPAPERTAPLVAQDAYAPKGLAQLVGTWAYSEGDCERLFQRRSGAWAYRQPVDKFAQAAIVESPKKILLPSAICRIDGAREAEGMLRVSADCEDSISYTSRSVMIALRSPTELTYSASGDSVLGHHPEEMRAVGGNVSMLYHFFSFLQSVGLHLSDGATLR